MPPIPFVLQAYLPALLALAVAAASVALCRGKTRAAWGRVGLAVAAAVGWAALQQPGRLWGVALAPSLAPSLLLVPAAGIAAVEALRVWRRGRNDRWLSVLAAFSVGGWLARNTAGPDEWWRVAIVAAVLAGLVAAVVRGQAGRALAIPLALWGGLEATGLGAGWAPAAAVAAACCAAPLVVRGAALLPSATLAALIAALDLSRGRLARGRFDAVDLVCLLALVAPLLIGLIEPRLPKKARLMAPVFAAAIVAGVAWGLRRTVLG